MSGLGTDDDTLMEIIITRSEVNKNPASQFYTSPHYDIRLTLIRPPKVYILTCPCHIPVQIDLRDILEFYEGKYDKPLKDAVASETSGDYRETLIRILGNDDASNDE